MSNIEQLEKVRFDGVFDGKNVSGVTFWNDIVLVVSDEITKRGNIVQAFEQRGTDFFALPERITVLDEPGSTTTQDDEMDLEGITVDGRTVYVLGSHSARRKRVDKNNTRKENRAHLMSAPKTQPKRDVLLRFVMDAHGVAGPIERTSLRKLLSTTEPFSSYSSTAGKENGVDAEGITVWDERLYVGFRGPVLRGNYTPIIRFKFETHVEDAEVLFVNLGGRGVRDLARVDEGLLILSGPIGDGPGSYRLDLWNGCDGVPGSDASPKGVERGLRFLGDLPLPPHESDVPKAEGLAVVGDTIDAWTILVVFDGLKNGVASRYRVKKPLLQLCNDAP